MERGSYDRAGMGWSDTGQGPRSPEHIADELAVLLDRADIDGPYLLVAHSLAGKNARLFAMRHREEVVGMVLIDARHEHVDEQTTVSEQQALRAALDSQSLQYGAARWLGIARLFGDHLAGEPSMTTEVREEMALIGTKPAALTTMTELLISNAPILSAFGNLAGT